MWKTKNKKRLFFLKNKNKIKKKRKKIAKRGRVWKPKK
jgi:hypothetical protein